MFVNDEKYLKFLIKHNLTASQFLFCYLLATKDRNHKYLVRYSNEVEALSIEEYEDLVKREYVHDFNSPGQHYHDMFVVQDKFKDALLIDSEDAFEELWKAYPMHLQTQINGKNILAKTTSLGKLGLMQKYGKFIGNDLEKHKRVMEALKWAKETSRVNLGIEKFVLNHIWEDWLEERKGSADEYGHINVI